MFHSYNETLNVSDLNKKNIFGAKKKRKMSLLVISGLPNWNNKEIVSKLNLHGTNYDIYETKTVATSNCELLDKIPKKIDTFHILTSVVRSEDFTNEKTEYFAKEKQKDGGGWTKRRKKKEDKKEDKKKKFFGTHTQPKQVTQTAKYYEKRGYSQRDDTLDRYKTKLNILEGKLKEKISLIKKIRRDHLGELTKLIKYYTTKIDRLNMSLKSKDQLIYFLRVDNCRTKEEYEKDLCDLVDWKETHKKT